MINQTKLTEAGSQFWNKNILASGKNKFAFASTLAVYVYEIIDNKGLSIVLDKILSDHTSTITAIEWNPKEETQLATASEAGDVYIWSIRSERPKIHVELDNTIATMLHWNPVNSNNLLFVLKSGELKYLKINEREIEKVN